MFHTILTLSYIIPNIYVFLRIWKLFINKGYRLHYTIIYLLLASVSPISNLISEESAGLLNNILSNITNYLLPFYLYLFLFILLFDLFLLFNFVFKIVSQEKLKRTKFRITGLSLIVLFAVIVVIYGVINFNTIRTSEYKVEIPGKSTALDNLKIAFVADFHLQEKTNINFVEDFVRKIEIINPDILLFGGDIVEGNRSGGNLAIFEDLFRGIGTKYGKYAVLGNHEYYSGQDKGIFFIRSGIKLLCDTIVVIDSSFSLAGRYDSHFSRRKTISELIKSATGELPLILLDHRPTELDEVSRTSVDLQLSGHTHNGQMFPINLITRSVYELSWGYKKIRDTHFFVTSGIRLWGPPVRTSGKSEIMVINILFTRV